MNRESKGDPDALMIVLFAGRMWISVTFIVFALP
jgi:hypothetical protein